MGNVPTLLDAAGDASMATAIMMSHHAFRRDVARFAAALKGVGGAATDHLNALRDEWANLRNTLHEHHHAEDTGLFPALVGQHESLRSTIERLTAEHRHIDPILERGDRAFAELPETVAAGEVIAELTALLAPHLAAEEDELIPHMRAMKAFPPPGSDQEAATFADGFAWASHGIAPDVLERVYAMLPASVATRLPAARAAFDQRWRRVWGSAEVGASRTPIPEP